MTVQALPWAIQGQTHTAEVARNALAATFGAPVAALVEGISLTTAGGAHGVVGSGDLVVAQNTVPDRNVLVAAGRAIIRSTEAASLLAGAYSFLNDAALLALTAASDPTNPRIDLIIAQVRDSNYSGANTDSRIAVVTGTPAGAPVTPTVPDSCIVLAQVAVAAASTTVVNANITDKRTRAYSLGGVAVCTSVTRPSGVSLFPGLVIYETDTFRELTYDGTGFVIMSEPSQAWTPAFPTGVTLGNGVSSGTTKRGDGWIDIDGSFVLGTTSAITGDVSVTLPIVGSSFINSAQIHAAILDSGTTEFATVVSAVTTVKFNIRAMDSSVAVAKLLVLSATVPMTWAVGDTLWFAGRYPMTTRYS